MSLWMWISVLFVFLILSYLLVTNVWFQNCFSYRFTILIRQHLPLYYFRTNTSLSSVGTQQILLYQDLFIKVKQCFCKVSRKRASIMYFFSVIGSWLPYCLLYTVSRAFLENKGNRQQNKKCDISNRRGIFSLFWVFLKEKTTFSLHFSRAAAKMGVLDKRNSYFLVVDMFLKLCDFSIIPT